MLVSLHLKGFIEIFVRSIVDQNSREDDCTSRGRRLLWEDSKKSRLFLLCVLS